MVFCIEFQYDSVVIHLQTEDRLPHLCKVINFISIYLVEFKEKCLRKYVGRWWAARSSKPVGGMRNSLGGFDSHVLPPFTI